jgi:alpha-tubulin suppressor-like RCC1 family protein
MAAGKDFTCALASGGSVYCWGENTSGQTGDGSLMTPRLLPGQVMGLPGPASAISAGERHACALVAGELWCWGSSGDGQLGEGVSGDQTTAHQVQGLAGVDRMAAGGRHTCVRLGAAGGVRCFGANASGQLGNGGSSGTDVPQVVSVDCP